MPVVIGLVVVMLFAGSLVAWSAFAPLSDAAVAEGVIQVQGRRQEVQHPYGGVVRELRAGEGDLVAEGDVLISLSDVKPKAELDVLTTDRDRLLMARARIAAEQRGAAELDPPVGLSERGDGDTLLAAEQAILRANIRQHASAAEVIERRGNRQREQITGAVAEMAGLERQLALLEDELNGARRLFEQGLTTRPKVLELERGASQLRGAIGAKQAEIGSARQAVAEAEAERAGLDRQRVAELAAEQREIGARLAEIEPKIDFAEDTLRQSEIRAPAGGRVVELAVFTEGGVIQPGARLMSIVPSDAAFFVEARLRLTELHGIRPGQAATIELLSTPRQERPHISGRVTTISADRIVDERTGQGYYALQIALDEHDTAAARIDLQAGMPVQAIMPTRERTLIDYLMSPLLDEVSTAFREY